MYQFRKKQEEIKHNNETKQVSQANAPYVLSIEIVETLHAIHLQHLRCS